MSSLRERRLGRMSSAQTVLEGAASGAPGRAGAPDGLGSLSGSVLGGGGAMALKSPLAQVKTFASSLPLTADGLVTARPVDHHSQLDPDQPIPTAPPSNLFPSGAASAVPAPNFNLFRSASVYSTDSDASDLTFLSEDTDADTLSASSSSPPLAPFAGLNLGEISGLSTPRAETPTTPRGVKPGQGYFDAWAPVPAGPGAQQGQVGQVGHGRGQGYGYGQPGEAGPSRHPAPPPLPASLTTLPPRSDSIRYRDRSHSTGVGRERDRERDEEGDGQETPKKSFVVRSRPAIPIEPMGSLISASSTAYARQPYQHQPQASTSTIHGGALTAHDIPPLSGRSLAETHGQVSKLVQGVAPDAHAGTVATHLPTRQSMSGEDWESIHGEQGSEWGDDTSGEEEQGVSPTRGQRVNGTRAGETVQGVDPSGAEIGGDGRPTAWLVNNPSSTSTSAQSTASGTARKQKRNIIIPRRAAPPPPPGPGTPQNASEAATSFVSSFSASASAGPSRSPRMARRPSADTAASVSSFGSSSSGGSAGGSGTSSRQALQPRWPNEGESMYSGGGSGAGGGSGNGNGNGNSNSVFDPARIPLEGGAGNSGASTKDKGKGRAAHTHAQLSVHTDQSRPGSASSYTTAAADMYGHAHGHGRSSALPSPDMRANGFGLHNGSGSKTPSMDSLRGGADVLLAKGLGAKAKGDLAKAAWYYKQSADAGNSTGRIYWGLALKHGLGVARDDHKAFQELQQACDDALADEGVSVGQGKDRRQSIIQPGARKAMSKELCMGIAEMANCFLDGTGVKKSPDAATSYLRFAAEMGDIASQEQLGFLFSKGASGVKKDMHEAARWYRMAINQGSSNTFGLAWVWKDKYND